MPRTASVRLLVFKVVRWRGGVGLFTVICWGRHICDVCPLFCFWSNSGIREWQERRKIAEMSSRKGGTAG